MTCTNILSTYQYCFIFKIDILEYLFLIIEKHLFSFTMSLLFEIFSKILFTYKNMNRQKVN